MEKDKLKIKELEVYLSKLAPIFIFGFRVDLSMESFNIEVTLWHTVADQTRYRLVLVIPDESVESAKRAISDTILKIEKDRTLAKLQLINKL
jgi:hypothetical protein